jgi:hypothetical protein
MYLQQRLMDKDSDERAFRKMQEDATKQTMANIDNSVATGEAVLPWLQAVRDISAVKPLVGTPFWEICTHGLPRHFVASLLPQHQIHRPAPPHIAPRSAQVAQQLAVGAACVLR